MDKLPISMGADVVPDVVFEQKTFDRQSVLAVFDASTLRGGNAAFRVVCLDEPDKEFSVTVATKNGTASAGSDYTALTGTFIFDGEGVINVPTFGAPIEADEEFTLSLSSVDGFVVRPSATGRIRGIGNTHVYAADVYDADVYA